MSLSERLERARKQRMLDPDATNAEEGPEGSDGADPRLAVEIQVLPIGLHSVVEVQSTTGAGAARRCPACRYQGRVDLVDLVGQREHLTCEHCGAMWQINNADLAELFD